MLETNQKCRVVFCCFAKILNFAFPKLVAWFTFVVSWQFLLLEFEVLGVWCLFCLQMAWQWAKHTKPQIHKYSLATSMLHLLLLYPHLGYRIGPQHRPLKSTNPLAIHCCESSKKTSVLHFSYFTYFSSFYLDPNLQFGWGIESATGYKKGMRRCDDVQKQNIRHIQSTWINPDWKVDGAFLWCVQSVVGPYLIVYWNFKGFAFAHCPGGISPIKAWWDVGNVRYLWHMIVHSSNPQKNTHSRIKKLTTSNNKGTIPKQTN